MPGKINVLMAASEASPLAQTGGLAEVAGSLPQALQQAGLPTSVILPAYRRTLQNRSFKEIIASMSVPMGSEEVEFSVLAGQLNDAGQSNVAVQATLIKCDRYFDRDGLYEENGEAYPDNAERFAFFCKAVMAVIPHLPQKIDVVLANDWQTGLLMPYLREQGPNAPIGVFVIHNQGFLGLADASLAPKIGLPDSYAQVEGMEYFGQLSFLKAGIVYSEAVVAVSPTYAKEIQTPEGGNGLDGVLRLYSGKLSGIVNGVDHQAWNPATDKHVAANYSAKSPDGKAACKKAVKRELGLPDGDRPLLAMVSRLTAQKGISLLIDVAPEIFRLNLDLIILGTGEKLFEEQLQSLAEQYPDKMRLVLKYSNELAHKFIAGSDFVLVPSMYEPCGLVQLYALRYGSIPIVRAVGGLNDTVRDFAGQNPDGVWDNGLKFSLFQASALTRAVHRAAKLYESPSFAEMCRANMREDHSWAKSAGQYAELFQRLLENRP
ncbi:MAG: glycogen synthase GlgA [Deltaproteobacteria bacterium]|jgi:starch synthase|nr:glycogen synthase GlgA [Deltaproteobacteria bacterium]